MHRAHPGGEAVQNTGNTFGISVVDARGNWIRIFNNTDVEDHSPDEPSSQLAKAMRNAMVLPGPPPEEATIRTKRR